MKNGDIVESRYSGKAEIIGKEESGKYIIKFFNSGNIDSFKKVKLLDGGFIDRISEEQEFISKIYPQKCGDSLRVLKRSSYKKEGRREAYYECEFIKYPYKVIKTKIAIVRGECENYNKPNEFGFIRGKIVDKQYKYIFDTWRALERCYNKNFNNYNFYKDNIVSNEFKYYPNFEKWYIENSKWNICNYKLEIDKDILYNINHLDKKIYSPKTCLLISDILNNFLSGDNENTGVRLSKSGMLFETFFENKYKGFKTFKEAKFYYAKQKSEKWIKLINQFNLPSELKEILLKYDFTWYWKLEE